jgi:hypothetical protein
MRRAVIALVVIAGLLVVADRVAKVAAQSVVATQIKSDQALSQRPDVTIRGFPFLTQALAGRYGDVSLTLHDVPSRSVPVKRLAVDLHGVHVPLADVFFHHRSSVPVDRATATILLSFDDLNAYFGPKHLTLSQGSNDEINVTGSVTLAGRTVEASGSGRIDVNGSDLVVPVGHGLDFSIPLGGLPFRIALVGAKATKAGIVVQATASGLVLHPES